MTLSCTRQRIRTSKRRVDKLQIVSRLSFAIGFMLLLFGAARSDAADSCLDNLPTPTPLLHRVVQLVNCSNQRVLGTANAAHVVGSPPIAGFAAREDLGDGALSSPVRRARKFERPDHRHPEGVGGHLSKRLHGPEFLGAHRLPL